MVVCGVVGVKGQSLEDQASLESRLPAGVFRPPRLEATLQGCCGSVSRANEASEGGFYTSGHPAIHMVPRAEKRIRRPNGRICSEQL